MEFQGNLGLHVFICIPLGAPSLKSPPAERDPSKTDFASKAIFLGLWGIVPQPSR